MEFRNAKATHLFPDLLWSYDTALDNDLILKDVQSLRTDYPESRIKSNYGGWQGPAFSDTEHPYATISSLSNEIRSFINSTCETFSIPAEVDSMAWWTNVNKKNDYNFAHWHGNRTDFIAIYYPAFPKDSGLLVFHRTDGGALLTQNSVTETGTKFPIEGEVGTVYIISGNLLHLVQPHLSDEERISISYNIRCRPLQ